jgi:hypothetical protein
VQYLSPTSLITNNSLKKKKKAVLNTLMVACPHHIIHYRIHKGTSLFPVLYKINLNVKYETPSFSENRPMNMVRFSAVRTGHLYSTEVSISVVKCSWVKCGEV